MQSQYGLSALLLRLPSAWAAEASLGNAWQWGFGENTARAEYRC